jgi:mxaA protein
MTPLGIGGLLVAAMTAAQAQGLRVQASEPRAFGYRIGDTVQRHVSVHADAGWQLDERSLPRPGAHGGVLELRHVAVTSQADGDGRRHEIELQYQVFVSPGVVRTFEMPPFRLRFSGRERSEDARVDAWPVTVAPLVPMDVSPRHGLGELRPDRAPPLIDDRAIRLQLAACAAGILLALGSLLVIGFGPPWRAARNRPFARAWRQLRDLPPAAAGAPWRAACASVHAALNRSAGEVVFESGLDRFIARQPGFAAVRADLARFLQLSRGEFFAEATPDGGDAAWLVGLCRRCRDIERGFRVPRDTRRR